MYKCASKLSNAAFEKKNSHKSCLLCRFSLLDVSGHWRMCRVARSAWQKNPTWHLVYLNSSFKVLKYGVSMRKKCAFISFLAAGVLTNCATYQDNLACTLPFCTPINSCPILYFNTYSFVLEAVSDKVTVLKSTKYLWYCFSKTY